MERILGQVLGKEQERGWVGQKRPPPSLAQYVGQQLNQVQEFGGLQFLFPLLVTAVACYSGAS